MRALDTLDASRERRAFRVPGRVEVLGKHTDYAGGRSLLCAVERGFVVAVAPRADTRVRVLNADDGTTLANDASPEDVPRWWRYASTVMERVARDFPNARRGADIAFSSNLPADS